MLVCKIATHFDYAPEICSDSASFSRRAVLIYVVSLEALTNTDNKLLFFLFFWIVYHPLCFSYCRAIFFFF